jgi:hypothetical protein
MITTKRIKFLPTTKVKLQKNQQHQLKIKIKPLLRQHKRNLTSQKKVSQKQAQKFGIDILYEYIFNKNQRYERIVSLRKLSLRVVFI